jgi:2-methylisocitrate lyase-like PEP mutase family enzyme
MKKAEKLSNLMKSDKMIIAPGAFDCITARLIEQAGFNAIYMTGSGTAASCMGFPDYGLITLTEMAENAGRIADSVTIPLIADADTGYGNVLNVIRTVHEYEKAGVAALHIEDQVFPKKCGHLNNKEVVSGEQFIAKIKAAVQEKNNPDFIIIARTDSRSVAGFDEAIIRANEAIEAGADLAFVEAPETYEEIQLIPKLVKGPCLFNLFRGGKTPTLSLQDIQLLGYKMTILPSILLSAIIDACDEALLHVKQYNNLPKINSGLSLMEVFRRFGLEKWDKYSGIYNS